MTAPKRPAIELAALDMAGTTIEEGGAVYEALAGAVAAAGHPAGSEAIQRWMGADKRAVISGLITESSGTTPAGDTVEELYAKFRVLLQAAYIANQPSPIVDVPRAIAALRSSGVKVALTTGFSRDIAEPLLAGLGWTVGAGSTNTIDAVVCADDVVAGRPAPYMIFRAMEATGVLDVARVAVAGDTVVDLWAGSNAGARIVAGVATGKLTLADLASEPHTHLLASVAELPAVINALAR